MEERERIKQIIQNWFSNNMSIQPSEESLNDLVDKIYYKID